MTAQLEAVGIVRKFPVGRATLSALDGVDLRLERGRSIGIIGESGSGKSTLATILARLDDPDAGGLILDGQRDLCAIPSRAFGTDPARRDIQLVFQTATDGLNPSFTVAQNIALGVGERRVNAKLMERIRQVATEVDLGHDLLDRRPHQLSGGQQARAGIARALVAEPKILILDEPTAALDVSVQATILRLIDRLRRDRGLSIIFISHDLEVVRLMCDEVMVLYLGRVAEYGSVAEILAAPRHPYTRALVASMPGLERKAEILAGDPPSPIQPNRDQCLFNPRCPISATQCERSRPPLVALSDDHQAACFRLDLTAPVTFKETAVP